MFKDMMKTDYNEMRAFKKLQAKKMISIPYAQHPHCPKLLSVLQSNNIQTLFHTGYQRQISTCRLMGTKAAIQFNKETAVVFFT